MDEQVKNGSKKWLWGIVIIVAILILGLGYWSQNSTPTEVVKVGVIAPLSGPQAEVGTYIKNGLQLAEEEINNKSQLKVSLIFEDSQYKPDLAVAAAKKLIDIDKVKYIIIGDGSSQALAVAPLAEQNKVVYIAALSQASQLTQAGDYIFRSQVNVTQEVSFYAPIIYKIVGNKKIDILGVNNDYGIDYATKFSSFYSDLGGKVGVTEKYNPNDKDSRTQILKVKADKPDAVLIVGVRNQTGSIIRQASDIGLNVKFFGTSPVEGKSFLEVAGSAGEGLLYPYPFDENSQFPVQKKYQEKYLAKFGLKSEQNAANSYDALELISHCLNRVGNNNEKVKDCMYTIKNFPGATGSLTFDQNGDVSKPFILKTVKNGQFIKFNNN